MASLNAASPHRTALGFWAMGYLAAGFGFLFGVLESLLAVAVEPGLGSWFDQFNYVFVLQLPSALGVGLLFMIAGWLAVYGIGRVTGWQSWPAAQFGLMLFILFVDLLDYSKRVRLSAAVVLALGLAVQGARWFNRKPASVLRGARWMVAVVATVVLLSTVGVVAAERIHERLVLRRLPARPEAPSILLIVADALRADYLSTYGYRRPTTPFLDSLAEGGVLFERAYATSSWTLPSHMSIMTGRFPFEDGVRFDYGVIKAIDPSHPVLAEVFQEHGYATGGFVSNPVNCRPKEGFARGFLRYNNSSYRPDAMLRNTGIGHRITQYIFPRLGWFHGTTRRSAGTINGEFLGWLDGLDSKRPFFAFLNYMETHGPLLPPKEFAARFSPEPEKLTKRDPLNFLERAAQNTTPEQLQMELDAYAASVAYLDSMIAQLYADLKKRGRDQNLLVVFTADHGDSFGENGLYGHRIALYPSQIHVPLVFHYPGQLPVQRRISAPASQRTLARTLLEIARIEGDAFPGPSMAGAWGETPGWTGGPILAEVDGIKFARGLSKWPVRHGWLKSWITAEWQYILREDGQEELFDVRDNPQQTSNVAGVPENRTVLEELRQEMERLVPEAKTVPRMASEKPSPK